MRQLVKVIFARTLSNLKKLSIDTNIVVDGNSLRAVAQMPKLESLRILYPWTGAELAAVRLYSDNDVAEFRETRPDVSLSIDGKVYPSDGWPLTVVKSLDKTDPLPKWELPAGSPPPVVAPCKPEEAAALQQKWAEFLKRPVVEEIDVAAVRQNAGDAAKDDATDKARTLASAATTLKFALIPPGEFRKIFTRPKDPAIEPDMPVRRFRITKPYAMSTTEVTWDQFRQFVEATNYKTEAETSGLGGKNREFQDDPNINWRNPGWKPDPQEPVTQVTPKDAEAFCEWLTKQAEILNQKSSIENRKFLYRLPTEAEWLHACRAGSVHKHVVGPDPQDLADYAWTKEFLDPNPQASPLHLVAQKKPNSFGLHDTLGSVWEITLDSMSPVNFQYLQTNDPFGGGSYGLLGLSWFHQADIIHPDTGWAPFLEGLPNAGFRVLKQFDAEPLPGPLDRPLVLRPGQPMSAHALVSRPEKIAGLRSWSVELAGPQNLITPAIAVSPKGEWIATSGSGFGKINLWDKDGKYVRALLGHEGDVASVDFAPDGQWLASCEKVGGERGHGGDTARVWNVTTGAVHAVIPIPGWTHRIKFSPNNKYLAVNISNQSFLIVELATGFACMSPHRGWGEGLAWSPDSAELACSHNDNRLRIWDTKSLKVTREIEAPFSTGLEWSPDGTSLSLRNNEGKVEIRDAKTLEITRILASNVGDWPHALAWLPDSKRIVVAKEGIPTSIFDVVTGHELVKFDRFSPSVAVIDGGKQAVLESGGRLHFYDTSTGQKLREGQARGGIGGSSILAPNGQAVFSPGGNKVLVFDSATGQRQREFVIEGAGEWWNHHISPDNKWLFASTHWEGIPSVILDAETGKKHQDLPRGKEIVSHTAWSPDARWLAIGANDGVIKVWNFATGKFELQFAGHTAQISSLVWSPDGTRLASAANDKTVRIWNVQTGKLVASYDQFPEAMSYNPLAWAADEDRLWIGLTHNIVSLDLGTGTFGPLENFSNGGPLAYLNLSPDGRRLLIREGYGWTSVRGRDAEDRRLQGQWLGRSTQWHPDSRRFLGWEPYFGSVGYDVEAKRRLGMLFPYVTGDHWLCIGPTGHYRGSPGVEEQIVYVAMHDDGSQRTYTPAEFAKQFGWKNDPEKAELLGK